MPFDRNKPFNELPALPPAFDVETKAVLKECINATRALGELNGMTKILPDPSILINSIPLQEAKISSEIENIVTTQDKLFEANLLKEASIIANKDFDEDKLDPSTKEVLNYRSALRFGFEQMSDHKFNMVLVREICSKLRDKSVDFRGYGNGVIIGNPETHVRKYTPPDGGDIIKDMLSALEDYMLNYSSHDPLIRMALLHYQFESIHPFDDGNGRTGRILNILFLIHAKLLDLPVLYLSRFIIENKNEYYRLFREVTENGKWEDWILYILRGVTYTANLTKNRIEQINKLFDEINQIVKEKAPRIYRKELIEGEF